MVLTEAFAAGTPVVASDIAGYRDVVADGVDGLLVPRGDATYLAETLRDLALDRPRIDALAGNAAASAERYAWPRIAEQVVGAYGDARAVPEPESAVARAAIKVGVLPADGQERVAGAPPADARARARGPRRPDPPRPPRHRRARHRGRLLLGHPAHRAGADRRHARALEPGLGAGGAGADVRLDAPARRLLARDLEGRPARRSAADGRRRPGHVDRRPDVGHAAGAARRALARAGGGAPARAAPATGCPWCLARSSPRR